MHIQLVGTRIDVSDSDAQTLSELREKWPEFLDDAPSSVPADYRISVVSDLSVIRDTGDPEVHVTRTGDRWDLRRHDFVAHWDARARRAELRYSGYLPAFSSFMRVLLSITLREHGASLFHSAGVRVGDEALLFPGVSGTGKSTIAGLAAPRGILSDEINGLRVQAGRVWAYPTPFWGDLVRVRAADAAPLRKVVLLTRGGATALSPTTPGDAFAALLEGALFFDEGPCFDDKRAFTDSIRELATRSESVRLRFDLPENPWPVLDRA